ncbi:MAG TPA: ribulokinase [Acidothermaceae bacterium]
MSRATYVVGVDYGTLSGRALVVRVSDGAELGTAVHEYRHGVLENALPSGRRLPPDWALQHPEDYLDVLRNAVPAAVAAAGVSPSDVVGIATDFTACTVLPTRADGTPLCAAPEFADEPHSWVKLWKHHAAQGQADRINELARKRGEPWLARYGGKVSAEWQFAKALQVLEEAPEIYAATERWIEAADWIVWQLSGVETRNACTAGYKGIFQDGQYPSAEYLAELNPGFARFVADKLEFPLSPLGGRAGSLTEEAASWTGLPAGIAVAVGNVDAHVTAPAAQAVEAGQLVAIMGTSTCHVVNAELLAEVPGMCGVVDGGIVDGFFGYEAGQSGVGDIYTWLADDIVGGDVNDAARVAGQNTHEYLSALAADQQVGQHGLVALDWVNGNRSVLVDADLSGVIVGLTLATQPEDIYRALVEATAFGTRLILSSFEDSGVAISEFIAAGGLIKNDFVMQVYADVLARPISVIDTDQGPALGAAIHAAIAAGEYPDVSTAASVMGKKRPNVFLPNMAVTATYDLLYAEYVQLHDYFGRGENDVLHRLRAIRNARR